MGVKWKPSKIEEKKDPEAYQILLQYIQNHFILVIFNETGYNNEQTFGKFILPFWFQNS